MQKQIMGICLLHARPGLRYTQKVVGTFRLTRGQVGERLKPTDCKSVTPCGLRWFKSTPVHHSFRSFIRAERDAGASPEQLD